MKTNTAFILALAVLAAPAQVATSRPAVAQDTATSHCSAGETVYFSAAVDGSPKIVSLCGSADLEGDDAWLQYRFGETGNIELRYPAENADFRSAFTVRRYTRPRTTYLKFDFSNGGYTYAILEGYDADENPASTAFLRVRRDSDDEDVAKFDLTMSSDPLNIMTLEYKVRTEPFDE